MYKIAICEDEKVFANEHAKICRIIMEKLNAEYELTLFDDGTAFLKEFLLNQKRFDLFLLDIVLDETNGMEIANKIREEDSEAAIIFATSKPDYAIQGYSVKALHFLVKPVDCQILEELITADYNRRFENNFLVFKSGAQNLRLPVKDAVFLEIVGRRVAIHLIDGTHSHYYGKLSDFLEGFTQFVRCHKSYAVNISKIRELTQTDVILVNEEKVPVSRAYFKDTKKAFLRIMRNV